MKTPNRFLRCCTAAFALANLLCAQAPAASTIPLPENPRPDFERADWVNLNGEWKFRFDKENGHAANRRTG